MRILFFLAAMIAAACHAATTNYYGHPVIVDINSGVTYPANSVATPAQVDSAESQSGTAYAAATNANAQAAALKSQADAQAQRLTLYSTNYLVKSVCWVEGVGAVNFDPSNQVMRVYDFTVSTTSLIVYGVAKIAPLGNAIPALEWRATLASSGSWTNLSTYTVAEITVPAAYTNYAKAYRYTISKPAGSAVFIRMVDYSSGISGSGWYWLVYGDIIVNSGGEYYRGRTGVYTNICGAVTNVQRLVSGLDVELEPLGGL